MFWKILLILHYIVQNFCLYVLYNTILYYKMIPKITHKSATTKHEDMKNPIFYWIFTRQGKCYSGGRKLVSSLVERKDVSFILTIFPKNFWNKWYLIWKPLYLAFRISKKNWAWHHPEGGHAPLTEKALLLLKLVWSQRFFQFQNFFQIKCNRAFFEV